MITKLQVKYIQSLRQKKFRDSEGVFAAEGPKIINELLESAAVPLQALYATGTWMQNSSHLIKKIPAEKIIEIKEQELERISFLQTPHEVLGVFQQPATRPIVFEKSVSLMLDGIQDPGNMGTLIRTADWFGVRNIICSIDCADAFASKVVQATMGSIARVQLRYTELLPLVKANHLRLFAAALNGESLHTIQPLQEGVVVIGNESKGISQALLDCCQHIITIPRVGKAESLNAAVAAGIILSRLAPG